MNNYKNHALREFRAAGWVNETGEFIDKYQEAICNDVLNLLELFSSKGNSGTSAPYMVHLFEQLALFKAISPLTGEDYEWMEVSDGVFQNTRCSSVFKQSDRFDGQPYDIDGVIFYEWVTREDTGEKIKAYFTNSDSHTPITFPYTKKSEYVERVSI